MFENPGKLLDAGSGEDFLGALNAPEKKSAALN